MSDQLIRFYKKADAAVIKKNLLIHGDLTASCGNCQAMDFKWETTHCPACQAEFKYISFRNVRTHIPKIYKLMEERPTVMIIDYDDYSRNLGASKAKDFFK